MAILRLAVHEVRRILAPFRRPGNAVAILAVVALLAFAGPQLAQRGLAPDDSLYPVRVAPGSPLADAVAADVRFRVVEEGWVLDVGGTACDSPCVRLWWGAYNHGDDHSVAAARELQDALRHWQERELEREPDAEAAFPVSVNLILAVPNPAAIPNLPEPVAGTTPSVLEETAAEASVQADIRPDAVEPPFPVRSLLLTFAFLIPMNFVAQLHAGSLLSDRVGKRALLALTTPHAPRTILLGRTLPYLAAGVLVWIAASVFVGAGWQGWVAALPIVGVVLASSLLLGLLARSERELTFLLTGTTTMVSIFLFLPAIFSAIPAVAFLSPVSVLVASIEGDVVAPGLFAFATIPLALCTLALAMVGSALYREETLFSPRQLRAKVVSALAIRTRTAGHAVLAGAFSVPFAFILELLVLSLAIPLGARAALPVTLIGVAFVEERLKLAVVAARRRRGASPTWSGVWAGIGFFVGEKIALLLAIVGFGGILLGPETLRVFGVAGAWPLLIGPLILHAAASAIAAQGLGRRRPVGAAFFLLAVAVHVAYNLAVLFWGGSL